MKDILFTMMTSMMPVMQEIMWIGVIAAAIGFVLVAIIYTLKIDVLVGIVWSARVAFSLSIFFMLAQVMGYILGVAPSINFGDATKFEFTLVSFWQIGLGLLVSAIVIRYLGVIRGSKVV